MTIRADPLSFSRNHPNWKELIPISRLRVLILVGFGLAIIGEALPRNKPAGGSSGISQFLFLLAVLIAGGTIFKLLLKTSVSKRVRAATLAGISLILIERLLIVLNSIALGADVPIPDVLNSTLRMFLRFSNTGGLGLLIIGILFSLVELIVQNTELLSEQEEHSIAAIERAHFQRETLELHRLESLGELSGNIAHDFNDLLTRISANAGLLKEDVLAESSSGKRLKTILRSVDEGSLLAKKLLAYSGKGNLILQPVHLPMIVKSNESILNSMVPNQITAHFDIQSDVLACTVDENQVMQILINLIHNAAESFDGNTGDIWVRTGIRKPMVDEVYDFAPYGPRAPVEYACLEVIDNGCGIDQEIRTRIFEPFFSTKGTGRGLGLPAVLGIVRSYGGFLRIEPNEPQGTRVQVLFPSHFRGININVTSTDHSVLSDMGVPSEEAVLV